MCMYGGSAPTYDYKRAATFEGFLLLYIIIAVMFLLFGHVMVYS